jgi:hypothetical protein
MLQRLRTLWKLTSNPDILPEHVEAFSKAQSAEFLPDMTEEEVGVYMKEAERGWGQVFDKIRSLIK